MKFYFNILFVFILNFVDLECKIVKFKFEIYPINIANTDSIKSYNYYPKPELNYLAYNDFMYRLLTDDFYFNLTFGTPPLTIPNIWNMEKYSFKVYNKAFNISTSSSLKNISSSFRYNFDESNKGMMYEDNFYFFDENNNTFSNSLNFMKLELGDKNYSFVGLQLPDNLEDGLLTFPRALKQNKIINNYVFFIYYNKYQNNDEIPSYNGNIYFGEYPHNMKEFSNEFKENNFYEIRASNRSNFVYWDILFDNIYFGPKDDNFKKEYKQAEILGNMRISIGTEEYKDYISKNFFDIYVKNNICQLKIVINNSDYEYYQCLNNKLFNISQFPSIKFEIKEINFIFSLNYKDLFFIHNNYIYFSIIFDRYFKLKYNKRWRLGSALFKKYLLTFNQDTRMIGIYKNIMRNSLDDEININNDQKEKFQNNEDNNNKIIIKLFIIIGLLILIIFIILFIKKNIKKCNKKTKSKDIDFIKSKVGHDSKNKNIVHEYYELGNNLMEK